MLDHTEMKINSAKLSFSHYFEFTKCYQVIIWKIAKYSSKIPKYRISCTFAVFLAYLVNHLDNRHLPLSFLYYWLILKIRSTLLVSWHGQVIEDSHFLPIKHRYASVGNMFKNCFVIQITYHRSTFCLLIFE